MYKSFVKRMLDLLLSAVGIIVLAIPMLILVIAIKLDSPGPVLFKQKRVGIHKTHFNILKVRTMRIDTPRDMPTHMLENPEQFDFLVAYLEIGWDRERMANAMIFDSTGGSIVSYRYLRIYQSCTNTIGWMEENGLLTEETKRELVKRYGGPTEIFETTG